MNCMCTHIALEIPKFNTPIISTTNDHLFAELKDSSDVRCMLGGQIPDQIASVDVPHFDCFIDASTQQSRIILQENNGPNKI